MKSQLVGGFRSRDDFHFAEWLRSHRLCFVYEPECPCCEEKFDRVFVLPASRIIAQVRGSNRKSEIREFVKFLERGDGAKPFHVWVVEIIRGLAQAFDVYRSRDLAVGSSSIEERGGDSAGWTWCGLCGRPFIFGAQCRICPHCNIDRGFATEDSDELSLRREVSVGYWKNESEAEQTDRLLAEASQLLRRREEHCE